MNQQHYLLRSTCAIALCGLCSLSHAKQDGLYIGGGLMASSLENELRLNDINTTETTTLSLESAKTNVSGDVFMGYNFLINDQYSLSLELIALLGSPKITPLTEAKTDPVNGNASSTIQSKLKQSFAIAMHPSAHFGPNSSGYLIAGYRRGQVELSYTENDPTNGSSSYNNTHWHNGFEFGLGMEVMMNDALALRLEARRAQFDSKTDTIPGGDTISQKSYVNQASLKIAWYLDIV